MYLDETHLVVVRGIAYWRKTLPGQVVLRRVQAKFNRVGSETPPLLRPWSSAAVCKLGWSRWTTHPPRMT